MKSTVGKAPYELLPVESMDELVRAMEHGAIKHKVNDWREGKGMPWTWLIAAALRHAFALLRGEDYDNGTDGSGLHHGAHLACCGLMLVYYAKHRKQFDKDDRFKLKQGTNKS